MHFGVFKTPQGKSIKPIYFYIVPWVDHPPRSKIMWQIGHFPLHLQVTIFIDFL
jgi:hypothetical protein